MIAGTRLRALSLRAWLATCGLLLIGCTRCLAETQASTTAWVRVDFDLHGIRQVAAEGLADRATGRRVTADDPVRVASISKLVVTLGVMRLVEQGQLDLDRDVGDYLGWPLRHPVYPQRPITLRLLLSHRAGLTDDAGYVSTPQTRTRDQVADPRSWNRTHGPGDWFQYANLNFPVVAAAMERVTGERFDRLMDQLVLRPLGIEACFNWALCADTTLARAVVVYRANGEVGVDELHGRRPTCPVTPADNGSCDLASVRPGDNGGLFSPQGGLRISARNLAKLGRLLLQGGEVDGVRLLSQRSVDEMLRPAWHYGGDNGQASASEPGAAGSAYFCAYGLATQTLASPYAPCRDDPWGDGRERVGHGGDAYGLVSGLWIDRQQGRGVAYFITGGDLSREGTRSAFYAVEEQLLQP